MIPIEIGVLLWALGRTAVEGRGYGGQVGAGTLIAVIGGLIVIVGSRIFTTVAFPNFPGPKARPAWAPGVRTLVHPPLGMRELGLDIPHARRPHGPRHAAGHPGAGQPGVRRRYLLKAASTNMLRSSRLRRFAIALAVVLLIAVAARIGRAVESPPRAPAAAAFQG